MAKTNKQLGLKFDRVEVQEDGSCEYEITRNGVEIGTIHKDVSWCGDGYRADSYSLVLDFPDLDESIEECWNVSNVWSGQKPGKKYTAREALAAAKAYVREQCEAYDARKATDYPEGEGPEAPVAPGLDPHTGAVDCTDPALDRKYEGTELDVKEPVCKDVRRYFAIAANHWGRAHTPSDAIKQCRKAGGRGRRGVDIHVYQLPEGAYDGYVDEMGGINWSHPKGREGGRGVWVIGGPKK